MITDGDIAQVRHKLRRAWVKACEDGLVMPLLDEVANAIDLLSEPKDRTLEQRVKELEGYVFRRTGNSDFITS